MRTLLVGMGLLWAGVAAAGEMDGVVTQLDFQRRVVSVTAVPTLSIQARWIHE